jgi:23S rRNA (cytidine1920-2'-O)/16S rRNA (cytidine1409-2'-O)-methyltransferase
VAPRRRLDVELVRRGRVASRAEAQALIADHRVLVGGAMADKASRLVAPADAIELVEDRPTYVGRGGRKLEHALDHFDLDVAGLRALDAGASTGGFTDCLLQRGAREVVSLDVGHGQLHERIRADPRVLVLERTNVRGIDAATIGGRVDLVVADLSFISLALVADALVGVCQPGASMVLLVKPQFEAGRAEVSRGRGVITDPEIRRRVLDEVAEAYRERRCEVVGHTESPITGADGNVEYLLLLRAPQHQGAA